MKKLQLLLLFVAFLNAAGAQVWEFHIASGLGYGRLLPMNGSTARSKVIRYGFNTPALYFSPEVAFKVNDNSRFSIGYQLSGNRVGIQFLPNGHRGARVEGFEVITLHNFSVGYSYRGLSRNEKVQAGWFAKVGIAYGQLTGVGSGGHSGQVGPDSYLISSGSQPDFDIIPDFWAPTSTVGICFGPNAKKRRIADRLLFTVAATIAWKNPYIAYSKIEYSMETPTSVQEGIAQYQGMPMSLQIGMDYNLFNFRKKNNW